MQLDTCILWRRKKRSGASPCLFTRGAAGAEGALFYILESAGGAGVRTETETEDRLGRLSDELRSGCN